MRPALSQLLQRLRKETKLRKKPTVLHSMTLRTNFYEADYVGELIPTGNITFNALIGEFNGTPQVIPLPSQNQLLRIFPKPISCPGLFLPFLTVRRL